MNYDPRIRGSGRGLPCVPGFLKKIIFVKLKAKADDDRTDSHSNGQKPACRLQRPLTTDQHREADKHTNYTHHPRSVTPLVNTQTPISYTCTLARQGEMPGTYSGLSYWDMIAVCAPASSGDRRKRANPSLRGASPSAKWRRIAALDFLRAEVQVVQTMRRSM